MATTLNIVTVVNGQRSKQTVPCNAASDLRDGLEVALAKFAELSIDPSTVRLAQYNVNGDFVYAYTRNGNHWDGHEPTR